MKLLEGVNAGAALSADGVYRYALTRDWFPKAGGHVLWVMLNPSTADADVDDATVRKCQKFARTWGFDRITVGNLFALRATRPRELYSHPDPVGPANDVVLHGLFEDTRIDLVVAAWGAHGKYRSRGTAVRRMAADAGRALYVLKLTNEGQPWHPLYMRDDTTPWQWTP